MKAADKTTARRMLGSSYSKLQDGDVKDAVTKICVELDELQGEQQTMDARIRALESGR